MQTANKTSAQTLTGTVATSSYERSLASTRASLLTAFVLGAGIIFLVGFAHSQTIHDAAHDTRHSMAFPCH